MNADVIIIGAGPAGMMAAGICGANGLKTLVLDKNRVTGRKLRITGKGRCNVTNETDIQGVLDAVVRNNKFLYSALNACTPYDVMRFFEARGVPLKTERGNRVFPVSDRADDIADALKREAEAHGVQLRLGTSVKAVNRKHNGGFCVKTNNDVYHGDIVLLACGGGSYPGTGSNGDGARLAKSLGHQIIPLRPSLVPLVEEGDLCGKMQGLSLKNCAIKVLNRKTGRTVVEDFGELLFTHFGLSGPVILSASAHMQDIMRELYSIVIDLKPALDEKKLDLRLQREFLTHKNKLFMNALDALLPQKMIPVMIARSGIPPETRCNEITRQQRVDLRTLLKGFEIPIAGFRPLSEAIVTSGGVSVKEVDPKTMQSKLLTGLYFAGEILDLDAYTGGFNLQIAFSTGFLAGNAIVVNNT